MSVSRSLELKDITGVGLRKIFCILAMDTQWVQGPNTRKQASASSERLKFHEPYPAWKEATCVDFADASFNFQGCSALTGAQVNNGACRAKLLQGGKSERNALPTTDPYYLFQLGAERQDWLSRNL